MLNNIFDSHAHYNDNKFDSNRAELLNSLNSNGIDKVINVGTNLKESYESAKLAQKYSYIFSSIGVHPYDAETLPDDYLLTLEELSKQPKVVAIGEIGLDYFNNSISRELQKKIFNQQLELAHELKMPVIIHTRDADQDTIEILKKFKLNGVVHCFSSSPEIAKILLNMNFYLGFTGVITFKNNVKQLNTISIMPIDKILIETDCPYMAPEPYRGKVCNSSMLPFVIEKISQIKNEPAQKIADITNLNAKTLFGIK